MQTVGIICEYNPFHTGHAWQIGELRRRGAEAVVCCMSGNFVQRGDFAILRKHTRAEAAVRGGADLVVELPLPWALASAEGFAHGGVEVLHATGVVDTLAFGSECADTEAIVRVADALLSDGFAPALKAELERGDSFAAARQRAAARLLGADAEVLGNPNDILGVEYSKALRRLGSEIAPLALARMGAAHDGAAAGEFASASEIRTRLLTGADASAYLTDDMSRIYKSESAAGRAPVQTAAAERAILSRLRTMTEEEFAAFDEGNEGLHHRFYDAVRSASNLAELYAAAKTKRYALARLRRLTLAAYLGIFPEMRRNGVPYIRVLAMSEKGKTLLHKMRKTAKLPVVVKSAEGKKMNESVKNLLETEARATDLYTLAYPDLTRSTPGSEWRTNPVILEGEER